MPTRQSKNFIRLFGPMKMDLSSLSIFKRRSLLDLYVDGGIKHFQKKSSAQPQLWIGDGDSKKLIKNPLPQSLQLWLPRDKNLSDFEAALNIIPDGNFEVVAYGFLGGKSDHEWGGILAATQLIKLKKWKKIIFIGKSSRILILNGGKKYLEFEHKGKFSLFTFHRQEIFLEGKLDYQGKIELPALSTKGLSNVSHGKWTIKNQHPILLFL
ncbi:MAG: hypothetical protein QE271_08390 [Bacteriovoracaceae bacterium]|nr:hypothetical protein [Bacteriovoracaceae bacterium]